MTKTFHTLNALQTKSNDSHGTYLSSKVLIQWRMDECRIFNNTQIQNESSYFQILSTNFRWAKLPQRDSSSISGQLFKSWTCRQVLQLLQLLQLEWNFVEYWRHWAHELADNEARERNQPNSYFLIYFSGASFRSLQVASKQNKKRMGREKEIKKRWRLTPCEVNSG